MADRAPQRIQLSRAKGWRKPAGAVVVSRPTIWGNQHSGGRWDDPEWELGPYPSWRACVVDCYRRWLQDEPVFMRFFRLTVWGALEQEAGDPARAAILARLPQLRGRDLACWCPLDGEPCHADVLLEMANRPEVANG